MQMIDLKRAVKFDRKATFMFYRDGALFYSTEFDEIFEITTEEAKGGTFNRVEKALRLMRWMRKHNERIKKGLQKAEAAKTS